MSSVDSQFQVPPFPSYPSAKRFVRVGSQDEALQRVRRAIEAWEAISLVIGPPGTGKTLIVQMLAQMFAPTREVIVLGDATIESPASLQRYLLRRLARTRGIEPITGAVDDLQLTLIEMIESSTAEFPGLLLLVDEAQSLSPEVLETIRILTNVMSSTQPLVSAVLLGGPRLDETLALPALEALVQRVATRCYLHPLSSDEAICYVRRVITDCGHDPHQTIEEPAIRTIHRACGGVPRLINQLMSAAIDTAAAAGQSLITKSIVDRAWSVLQQLPSPMVDELKLASVHPVEFGPLLDDPTPSQPGKLPAAKPTQAKTSSGSISLESFVAHTEISGPGATADLQSVTIDCNACDTMSSRNDNVVAKPVGVTPAVVRTPPPSELFGEFEVEELLTGAGPIRPNDPPRESNHDLESSLHQEILSLRGSAGVRLRSVSQDYDPEATLDHPLPSRPNDTPPSHPRSAAPVLWLNDHDTSATGDDADLLVIEDDIPVEAAEPLRDDIEAIPMSVDFQSMLAKMRSPQGQQVT